MKLYIEGTTRKERSFHRAIGIVENGLELIRQKSLGFSFASLKRMTFLFDFSQKKRVKKLSIFFRLLAQNSSDRKRVHSESSAALSQRFIRSFFQTWHRKLIEKTFSADFELRKRAFQCWKVISKERKLLSRFLGEHPHNDEIDKSILAASNEERMIGLVVPKWGKVKLPYWAEGNTDKTNEIDDELSLLK